MSTDNIEVIKQNLTNINTVFDIFNESFTRHISPPISDMYVKLLFNIPQDATLSETLDYNTKLLESININEAFYENPYHNTKIKEKIFEPAYDNLYYDSLLNINLNLWNLNELFTEKNIIWSIIKRG